MSVESKTLNETINLNETFLFLTDLVQRCGRIISDAYHREKVLGDKLNYADFCDDNSTQLVKLHYCL